MVRTSLKYDHFDLYLTPVTLTFILPEKIFQKARNLLEGNNCANLFRIPRINVKVMLRTSSIHVFDHFDLYLTPVTLTFNLPIKRFKWIVTTTSRLPASGPDKNEDKQSCHSCTRHSVLTCSIILQSIIKIFLMVTELCFRNENEVKHGSGDMIRKRRYAELSVLYATLRVDRFYNPTKYR